MSKEKLDLILKVFGEIRDKRNGFSAETNLDNEFRGFRIELNNLENKIMLQKADKLQNESELLKQQVIIRKLETRIERLEEQPILAA